MAKGMVIASPGPCSHKNSISWHFSEESLRRIQHYESEAVSDRPSFGDRIAGVESESSQITAGKARRAVDAGHSVICELINAFKPWVYRWGSRAIEGPHWDRRYGIKPLLFHILRREYVERDGIAVCANVQCRQLFEIERAGQRFCGEQCSRRQRQRDYWKAHGKRLL